MSLLDHDLEYFLATAAHTSLAKAAATLGISQPTLSRSIQKLELRLGTSLLERTAHGVALTLAGKRLAERAQVAQVALDDADREIRDMGEGRHGLARVATGFTLWPLVASTLVPRLQMERPVATLELNVLLVDQIVNSVAAGKHDFGVCSLPRELPPELEGHKLLNDELIPIVRSGHPLTQEKACAERLLDYPWIGIHSHMGIHSAFMATFHSLGLSTPHYAVRTDSFEAAFQAVKRSDFITLAPRWRVNLGIRKMTALVALDIPDMTYRRVVGIVQRRHAYLGPIAQRALELVQTALAQASKS